MCTIRRARIKKLIKYQKKGKYNCDLFLINIDALPKIKISLEEAINLMNQKGVIFANSIPSVQRIRSTRPRNI